MFKIKINRRVIKFAFTFIILVLCLLFSTNALADSLEFFKPNMSFEIEKEIIKDYADTLGWEETRKKIGENHISYYEKEYDKIIIGTLWTPTLAWVDIMYETDLYFEDEQVAEDRYESFKYELKSNNKVNLELRMVAIDNEEVKLENLTFILETNRDDIIRDRDNADISSRGIERVSAFDITAYMNIVDLNFYLDDLEITNLNDLKLYIIFEKSRKRIELDWDLYSDKEVLLSYLIQQSPLPVYPLDLVGKNKTGTVLVEAIIDSDGNPKEVDVLKSSGIDSMDRNAKSTIERGWSFRSYNRSYIMEIEVIFDVDERENPVIGVDLLDLRFE